MARDTVLTGYYRYTDIWFEWAQALPDVEDREPLKAVLAHDALVHPEHPLHIDGVDGVQLYIGTFSSGEARLLFSSAQVDYIRYWLHAMGLIKHTISLPYSDCLLTESSLHSVSPVVYSDGSAVRAAIKTIDKNNKRLKGSNPKLTHRRHVFERVRTLWAEKKGIWCAIDFEAWERDHTVLTEVGWSFSGWKDGMQVEGREHLIVEEAKRFTNSQYVPDHRYDYQFGSSKNVTKAEFKRLIGDLLSSLTQYGPVFLVFHDDKQDIKYLQSANIDAPLVGLSYTLPDGMPDSGLFVIDTADLIGALLGDSSGNSRGLEKMCNLLQIKTSYLHNAGNDAEVTMMALKAMANGDPIDIQREKRWPNQTSSGVTVELKPWQEDSDYSDEEGVIPPSVGYDLDTGELNN